MFGGIWVSELAPHQDAFWPSVLPAADSARPARSALTSAVPSFRSQLSLWTRAVPDLLFSRLTLLFHAETLPWFLFCRPSSCPVPALAGLLEQAVLNCF